MSSLKTHYSEIALTCKQKDEIEDHLNDLMSTLQELKIDCGISTQREVRQWKKDIKGTYALLLEMKTENRARSKVKTQGGESLSKFEQEKKSRREIQQHEKELWEEKMKTELKLTETPYCPLTDT